MSYLSFFLKSCLYMFVIFAFLLWFGNKLVRSLRKNKAEIKVIKEQLEAIDAQLTIKKTDLS